MTQAGSRPTHLLLDFLFAFRLLLQFFYKKLVEEGKTASFLATQEPKSYTEAKYEINNDYFEL